MTMHTDVQDVLDRLKTAQQKPLGDPRFKSLIGLEKTSTFSQARPPPPGLPSTIWNLARNFSIRFSRPCET
jgi:hypothetical protein